MVTNSAKIRIITLTGRRPVMISEAAWPIVSAADGEDGHSCLTVRQHADGRSIVHAVRLSNGADGYVVRKGEVVGSVDDVVEAIRRVAACCGVSYLADECIERMPPVSLD